MVPMNESDFLTTGAKVQFYCANMIIWFKSRLVGNTVKPLLPTQPFGRQPSLCTKSLHMHAGRQLLENMALIWI